MDTVTERPEHAPDPDHPLLVAARYNDADAEEHGFYSALERMGLVPDEVMYIAHQRALRTVLIESNRLGDIDQTKPTPIELSPEEEDRLVTLTAAVLDGVVIGYRAKGLEDG